MIRGSRCKLLRGSRCKLLQALSHCAPFRYLAGRLAGILNALGTETHLMFRGETVLRHGFDPFIVKHLMGLMQRDGPILHGHFTTKRLARAPDGSLTVVADSDGSEIELTGFDCVLMATGVPDSIEEHAAVDSAASRADCAVR